MKKSGTSRVLQEIAFVKIVGRSDLVKLCRGSSMVRVILHYLSKLKLIYVTASGYIILIPWLIYLKYRYNNKWIDILKHVLENRKVVVNTNEFEDLINIVENHPIESLYTFVKIYMRFQDYVDELTKVPSKIIPDYCKQLDFQGKDSTTIYLNCVAPLLEFSSWILELVANIIKAVVTHRNAVEALTSFFEELHNVFKEYKDMYSETVEKLCKIVQFLANVGSVDIDPIEKVVGEYSEKMRISYDERSYVRNLLKFIILSRF